MTVAQQWPALPYEEWSDTLDTLHFYTQIIGKLRLALSPFEAEWSNVALYVTTRGLGTSPIPFNGRTFDAEFDLVEHEVVFRSSDGGEEAIALAGQSVADFYKEVMATLGSLGVPATITLEPQEVPNPIPFNEDRVHNTYDPFYAHRFWQVLSRVDIALKRHRARFWGKASPVHLFWGSFDLAYSRFSGRRADPPAGSGRMMALAEDAEQITVGFWPGDATTRAPHFYAYGHPRPDACANIVCRPAGASWVEQAGLFLLPYDVVRGSLDPEGAVLEFLESVYEGLAPLLGWSPDLLVTDRPKEG